LHGSEEGQFPLKVAMSSLSAVIIGTPNNMWGYVSGGLLKANGNMGHICLLLSLLTSNPPTFPNIKSGSSAFEFQLTRL
jgi:hypothetical protein